MSSNERLLGLPAPVSADGPAAGAAQAGGSRRTGRRSLVSGSWLMQAMDDRGSVSFTAGTANALPPNMRGRSMGEAAAAGGGFSGPDAEALASAGGSKSSAQAAPAAGLGAGGAAGVAGSGARTGSNSVGGRSPAHTRSGQLLLPADAGGFEPGSFSGTDVERSLNNATLSSGAILAGSLSQQAGVAAGSLPAAGQGASTRDATRGKRLIALLGATAAGASVGGLASGGGGKPSSAGGDGIGLGGSGSAGMVGSSGLMLLPSFQGASVPPQLPSGGGSSRPQVPQVPPMSRENSVPGQLLTNRDSQARRSSLGLSMASSDAHVGPTSAVLPMGASPPKAQSVADVFRRAGSAGSLQMLSASGGHAISAVAAVKRGVSQRQLQQQQADASHAEQLMRVGHASTASASSTQAGDEGSGLLPNPSATSGGGASTPSGSAGQQAAFRSTTPVVASTARSPSFKGSAVRSQSVDEPDMQAQGSQRGFKSSLSKVRGAGPRFHAC